MPPLANPYVAGTALGQQHGFFGRDDVFTVVVGSLRSPDQNAVVLFGQRRIGKTSILLQLKRRLPSEEFVPVYFDLMDCAKKPLGRLLYGWAMTIARQIGMPKPDGGSLRALGIEDDDGNHFRERFLPAIYQHLPPGRRPVLLLDEFDVLDVAAEEQLPETAAARSFFPFLRQLLATERRLGFVFVIGRKAEDLSIDARATFKGAIYKRVSVLPPADARQLVGVAERQGSLTILPAAVDRLLHWTSGHPYLAQLLCQVLWERLCIDGMKSARNVEPGDVDAAVPEALQKGEQVFQWIWDGLPAAERVLFSATAVATAKKEWVRQDELLTLLQGHGIRILTRELTLAPDLLVEWEMLRKDADGYRFFVEMLRRWIVENKPLSRVKEELDRIVPEADTLYRGAEVYYRRRDLEGALGQLRNALNVNPNHLKARLRIGGILQEQGHLEAAVVELEHAYRYDEEAARYPLISALFRLGEEGDRLGTPPHGLLPYYQRILAISPGETVAQEHVQALSFRLAEEAQARGDLDGALTLYRRLGAMARVADLEEEKRSLALVALAEEAEALARQGSLHEATDRYLHLAAQDPEGPWASRAERCQRESQLAHCYAEAIGALKLQEWERAQTTFAEITAVRPDYRDAAQRLAYAVVRQRHHGRTGLFGVLIAVRVPLLVPALLVPFTLFVLLVALAHLRPPDIESAALLRATTRNPNEPVPRSELRNLGDLGLELSIHVAPSKTLSIPDMADRPKDLSTSSDFHQPAEKAPSDQPTPGVSAKQEKASKGVPLSPIECSDGRDCVDKAREAMLRKSHLTAVRYFEVGCMFHRDRVCCEQAGKMYDDGTEIPKDVIKARDYLLRAKNSQPGYHQSPDKPSRTYQDPSRPRKDEGWIDPFAQ